LLDERITPFESLGRAIVPVFMARSLLTPGKITENVTAPAD
jgi:hypothetical protein